MRVAVNIFVGLVGVGMAGGTILLSRATSPENDFLELSLLFGMAAVAIGCAVSFLWRPAARQLLALCLIAGGIGAIAADVATAPTPSPFRVDGGAGGKSGRQALLDMRADGKPAYVSLLHSDITVPDGSGNLRSVLRSNGEALLPMSGVAGARTLLCNETGAWVSYTSDPFGFRNPKSVWQTRPDIAAVGDSNTQGNCVEDGAGYVDRLRKAYPKTLNLGQRGNGPFAILASIREYLSVMRPAITIWFHYEGNDIPGNLNREYRTPLFARYLEPDFSQGLYKNAAAVSAAFARHIDRRLKNAATIAQDESGTAQNWRKTLKSRLTLYRLRDRLGVANFPSVAMIERYRAVLARAKDDVAQWDGKLLLVYLPTKRRFLSAGERRKLDRFRRRTLETAQSLAIPVLDMTPGFESLNEPERQYHEHFTEEGHARIAQAVARFLQDHIPKNRQTE